jgi:glycosyltransferase involved in cell wall biosynthesis
LQDDAQFLFDVTRLIWRRWVGRHPTGIDRVCLAYLRHFGARSQAVIQHRRVRRILDRNVSRELFTLLEEPKGSFRPRLVSGALRNAGRLRGRGRHRLYLNVGHTGLNSDGFRRWLRHTDVRPVYLVHDLIPITHPQFCRGGEDEHHRNRMRTVLTTAAGVIGNSQATLDALADFAKAEALPTPPMVAAWLGAEPLPRLAQARSERPLFIVVGTIEARKNHMLLLDIWSRLIDRFGDACPKLLIIGQRGWEADRVFERLDHDEKLRGHVIELSGCADRALAARLGEATALLFPSFVEGYGLPAIEALGLGVPVIASDLPIFHEIAGDIPTYLSPSDARGWEETIVDYMAPESQARQRQLQRLSSFKQPSWASHFAAVERWLGTLV